MDLSDTNLLISGLLIGTVGAAVFIYGKKTQNLKCLGFGVVLAAFPYFVQSLLLMWLIAGACMAGLVLLPRSD